jgi:uncharacterized protein YegL
LVLAGAVILVAAGWLAALAPATPAALAARSMQGGATPSTCVVTHTKVAAPSVIRLGETVDVTLTARVGCPGSVTETLHVVLVLDASDSMRGSRLQDVKTAAKKSVTALDMTSNPTTMVGVVAFNSMARTICDLTDSETRAHLCIDRVTAGGGTRIDLGIMGGVRVLSLPGGSRPVPREDVNEVMVIVTDGANNAGCAPVLSAARQARGQGIALATVCIGPDCDAACMRSVASSPRLAYEADAPAEIESALDEIALLITTSEWVTLQVFDELPAAMEYVTDSAVPVASLSDVPGRLWWGEMLVPTGGLTFSLAVRPTVLGHQPTNAQASGRVLDQERREVSWLFDVPYVLVIDPSVPPTVTVTAPPAPTPTVTPRPTDTPVVRPTSTPGWPVGVTPGVCDVALARAPASAVSSGVANPNTVAGFGERCNPSSPPGPFNGQRDQLSIEQPSKPYHPLYNGLAWKCGCP